MSNKANTAGKVSTQVRTLAGELKAAMSLEGSVITGSDESYIKHLDANALTIDVVRQVQAVNGEYIAATTLAVGEVADTAMQTNTELNQVTFEQNIGEHRISATVTRPAGGEVRTPQIISAYHAIDFSREIENVTEHLTAMWSAKGA